MAGENAFKKIGKRRNYKERAQPLNRSKHGLLPKAQDYKKKAKAKNVSAVKLQKLKRAAAMRNPDEFYFKMENSKMTDSYHEEIEKSKEHTVEAQKILKTKNMNYLSYKRQVDLKKIERLKESLHFLDAPPQNKRTVFADDESDVRSFDPAAHYKTVPEAFHAGTPVYRLPTKETLEKESLSVNSDKVNYIKWQKEHSYKELQARLKREEKIRILEQTTAVNKQILGAKKADYKVIESGSANTAPVVKWKKLRKG